MTDNKDNLTYEDVLKPVETFNDSEIIKSHWLNIFEMSNSEKSKIAEEILLQPYMAEVYENNGIKPSDVKEFIQKVAGNPKNCETVILNNSLAFDNNKSNSKDRNGDGISDGNNQKIDSHEENLMRKNELSQKLKSLMTSFVKQKTMESTPPEPEKKWWEKALSKAGNVVRAFAMAGGVAMIAGGTYLGVKIYSDEKNNDNNYGIVPDNNTSKAMKNAREKLSKDPKTNYDAFTKAEKKTPNKGFINIRDNGGQGL